MKQRYAAVTTWHSFTMHSYKLLEFSNTARDTYNITDSECFRMWSVYAAAVPGTVRIQLLVTYQMRMISMPSTLFLTHALDAVQLHTTNHAASLVLDTQLLRLQFNPVSTYDLSVRNLTANLLFQFGTCNNLQPALSSHSTETFGIAQMRDNANYDWNTQQPYIAKPKQNLHMPIMKTYTHFPLINCHAYARIKDPSPDSSSSRKPAAVRCCQQMQYLYMHPLSTSWIALTAWTKVHGTVVPPMLALCQILRASSTD